MRYTRYNIKKKKNWSNLVAIILIVVVAIVGGTLLAKIIYTGETPKNNINDVKPVKSNTDKTVEKAGNDSNKVSMIQCGYFGKKENADDAKKKLVDSSYKAVVLKDNDKFRVVVYIGDEKGADDVTKALNEKQINSMKVMFSIPKNKSVENQIGEIISGYLKLLNTINKADVKSIKTAEFKKWVAGLEVMDKGDNINTLKGLKENIKTLPEEITKENSESIYNEIFKIISNYKI